MISIRTSVEIDTSFTSREHSQAPTGGNGTAPRNPGCSEPVRTGLQIQVTGSWSLPGSGFDAVLAVSVAISIDSCQQPGPCSGPADGRRCV